MDPVTRRDWLKQSAITVGTAALTANLNAESAIPAHSEFHHDHVCGTSLDGAITGAEPTTVEKAEAAMLDEISRLERIFSLHQVDSEIACVNRSLTPTATSTEFRQVLRAYQTWQLATNGACHPQVGAFETIWKTAERTGQLPAEHVLISLAQEIRHSTWQIDDTNGTVTRDSAHPFNLNSAAKGYILGVAAKVLQQHLPAHTSGYVNLGGDIVTWGESPLTVGIQNPQDPAENAPLLGAVTLKNQAIATSGRYQRFFQVNGKRHSHIIDARTGQPADGVAAATVIATDTLTANMLATTLCVLGPADGATLMQSLPGTEYMIIQPNGAIHASAGFGLQSLCQKTEAKKEPATGKAWPADFQVTISIDLPKLDTGKRYRRPYTAIWIEDKDGKAIRTLAVWGNSSKYLKDLSDWWKFSRDNRELVKAVTRATRGPGQYEIVWDGKDDQGNSLPQGTFTVKVEVHREHGKHVRQSGKIECLEQAAKLKLDKNEETNETAVEYGKKKKS